MKEYVVLFRNEDEPEFEHRHMCEADAAVTVLEDGSYLFEKNRYGENGVWATKEAGNKMLDEAAALAGLPLHVYHTGTAFPIAENNQ